MSTTATTTPAMLTLNGETYTRTDALGPSPVQIVVLQRGWVVVGIVTYSDDQQHLTITAASVVRTWGTTKGLGEIAANGPTSKTVLDPAGTVRAHALTVVLTLDANADAWAGRL